jgi:uncharacterized protein (DUF362 family)
MKNEKVFIEGIKVDNDINTIKSAITNIFLKSTNNMEWLSKGDVVLLKPALNSDNPYPSTTHPLAISTISDILSEKGADVIIGDQSGLGSVLQDTIGVIRGNTHDNYIKSGMGGVDDHFVSFESKGWKEGFIHYLSKNTPSWPDGFYVTKWIEKADHIINLPRLSAHSQAGATLGFKNMVGILRDDSRMDFHANGPFNGFIKKEVHGSTLKSVDDGSDTFIEKIVEISDAIKDKLRLTLFVVTKAQATFGPNQSEYKLGNTGIINARVVNLNPGLVFASADPVAVESLAIALLKDLRKNLPLSSKILPNIILSSNRNISELDKIPVNKLTFIRHAIDIGLGQMPDKLIYNQVPDLIMDRLEKYLKECN